MRLKVSNVCQLLDKSKFWGTTRNGVTVTNNRDGTFTVNGTASYDTFFLQPVFQLQTSNPGYHTYLLDIGQYSGNANAHGVVYFYDDNVNSSVALIGTQDSSAVIHKINGPIAGRGAIIQARFAIVVLKGTTVTNWTIRPQLFDLTEMYGAGNEPTTVAQFRQDFPNEMYEYSPECWKKFRRLKYVTETKNLFDKSKADVISREYYFTLNQGAGSNFYVMTVKPGITYTVSYERFIKSDDTYAPSALELSIQTGNRYTDGTQLFIRLGDGERGVWITRSGQFTVPSGINQVTFSGLKDRFLYRNFMVQEGSTATPYQPYGYLPLNRGKYIANKEPVQLLDKSKYPATQTMLGVTFTNNGDGTITVNGTNTAEIYYSLEVLTSIPVGHKVIIDDRNSTLYFFGDMRTKDWVLIGTIPPRTIFILPSNLARLNMLYFVRYDTGSITYNNELSKPQLFDLTAMYGAGNEPTTVAQFRADYPNELYDYNPYNAITFR